jgi:hypothetical protein
MLYIPADKGDYITKDSQSKYLTLSLWLWCRKGQSISQTPPRIQVLSCSQPGKKEPGDLSTDCDIFERDGLLLWRVQ